MTSLGDRVIFTTGPWEGRDGVVVALEPASELAMVKVSIFGHDREVPVRLDNIRLANLTDPPPAPAAAPTSWELVQEIGSPHHFALFVRDAYRLTVAPDPAIPPGLDEAVPDLSEGMSTSERAAASAEWARWWVTVAGLKGGDLASRRLITKISAGIPVNDPPEPKPAGSGSALGQAIAGCQDEARAFARMIRYRAVKNGPPAQFDHQDINDVLDGLSRRTGRSKNSFRAEVTLINVRGPWWTATSSGEVLASLASLDSRSTVLELLSAAFR